MWRIGLVVTLAGLVGCYAAHGRDRDAGPTIDARTSLDAARDLSSDAPPVAIDAGTDAYAPLDASCSLVEERSVRLCVLTPTGEIPEEEPYTLRVERSQCLCAGRSCEVTLGADGRLELALTTCDTGAPCDECTREADCNLPPLSRGEHSVWIDGVYTGEVHVAPRRTVTEARPTCWAIPDAPPEAFVCAGTVRSDSGAGQLCHRSVEDVGTFVRFTLTLDCASCSEWSAGCEAVRDSAGSVLLRPRVQLCSDPTGGECGACTPQTVVCETPPLRDGTYDVIVESPVGVRQVASTLRVEDVGVPGSTICVPLG
ncbi:MAG: hypothetical protein K1X94_24915 [Sandaracinaceae bacterium]|nr:hypothetical protein [Sandaracinaceae bacterium]